VSLLIQNATIVPMTGSDDLIDRGYILVEGNTITAMGPGDPPTETPVDDVFDAEGQVVLPGLINTHTHCAMTLLRGYADDMPLEMWLEEKIWPIEMELEPEDVYWGTQLGIAEMIRTGTTCFNDMYHYFEQAAQAVIDSPIRAVLSGVLLGFLPNADRRLDNAIAFCREWNDAADGRLTVMLGPHALYTCPPDLLKRVRDAALENDLGIHIHVAETEEEMRTVGKQFGGSPIQALHDLGLLQAHVVGAHCVYADDTDIELMRSHDFHVAHNPTANLKLASGIAPIPGYLRSGVHVALGTDGPASNNNLDMFGEMRQAALIHKVHTKNPTAATAREVLEMATCNAARALRLEDRIGQLKPGMRADIVIVDFHRPHLQPRHNVISHLVYSASGADVDTVIIDGVVALRHGEHVLMDVERIYTEVKSIVDRLLNINAEQGQAGAVRGDV